MRILLKGYYGHNNLGDDYILYSLLTTLEKCGKNSAVIVSAGDHYLELFEKFHCLVPHVMTKPWRKISKRVALILSNVWIIGGGGYGRMSLLII